MARKKKRVATKKRVSSSPKPKTNYTWKKWVFNIAWILAVILALGGAFGGAWVTMPFWSLVLVILGIIVGFTYKTSEITPLLLIAIALVLFGSSSLIVIPYLGGFVGNAVAYFVTFLTPAALIVALRKIFEMLS